MIHKKTRKPPNRARDQLASTLSPVHLSTLGKHYANMMNVFALLVSISILLGLGIADGTLAQAIPFSEQY